MASFEKGMLKNVHRELNLPPGASTAVTVTGDYFYYHYRCGGVNDVGWGCGYRTLQTLCSWAQHQRRKVSKSAVDVPSLSDIQRALVEMQDKPSSFLDSRQWIGSVEVALCMDYFYDVPCKIEHVPRGADLVNCLEMLEKHFRTIGSPVMMGGESDNASKAVMGVCRSNEENFLLILDPHYREGWPQTHRDLVENDMLQWRPLNTFAEHTFYNLCLPQYKETAT